MVYNWRMMDVVQIERIGAPSSEFSRAAISSIQEGPRG